MPGAAREVAREVVDRMGAGCTFPGFSACPSRAGCGGRRSRARPRRCGSRRPLDRRGRRGGSRHGTPSGTRGRPSRGGDWSRCRPTRRFAEYESEVAHLSIAGDRSFEIFDLPRSALANELEGVAAVGRDDSRGSYVAIVSRRVAGAARRAAKRYLVNVLKAAKVFLRPSRTLTLGS